MEFLSQTGASTASDAVIAVFLVLLTAVSAVLMIIYICRFVSDTESVRPWVFAIIFGAGLALRLVFALCVRGYRDDYSLFTRAIEQLGKSGLGGYYVGESENVLYPIVYLVYLLFGGFANVTGLSSYGMGMQFFVKLPIIIAELLTAFAVYLIAGKYFNRRVAAVLCAFVCACPIFFIGSIWTSPIVFTAMFAAFAFFFLAKKNHAAAIGFFTAASFSSKEGIFLFPVACLFGIYQLVRAIINLRKSPPSVSGKKITHEDYRAVIAVPVGFVGSVVAAYLLGLPLVAPHSYSFFGYIYEFLIAPLVGWAYFTVNGLSVYSIFDQSGVAPGARFPYPVFALVFAAIIIAVVCVVYFTKRNRATLVMLGAYSVFTMLVYYPGMNAAGFASCLPLIVASYALVRDKRLLNVLFVAGLAYVINAVTLLSGFGYLNNFDDYAFGSEPVAATGAIKAVSIACAVLTVLSHLYFTYVTVVVGMTGQKRQLDAAAGFVPSMKEYFSGKKD